MIHTNSHLALDHTPLPAIYPLIDTHTHFDAPVFDGDRQSQTQQAYMQGVQHLVLVGYLQRYFSRLYETQQAIEQIHLSKDKDKTDRRDVYPVAHIALGLHPFYIEQHTDTHLSSMAQMIQEQRPLAIGEIGLDTYTDAMKQPEVFAKQARFFTAQLDIAVLHKLPVMLHIRKAHAEALALLKAHSYDAHKLGGIAHSFSGGEQEAKAFVKLGFKLGITGQITNHNAKKLRRAIKAAVDSHGIECLVLETDCPDMMPIMCQKAKDTQLDSQSANQSTTGQSPDNEWYGADGHNRNVPANLPWVLKGLSELLSVEPAVLAPQLWQNSCNALQTSWPYPK
ncbi:TatD family hydrolase [Psychrobacter sp. FBL11]|uniref:TatD family hydrolase n=1 Tax=Psychrobacter saeujeotis TaxID=3143436 RepID=A0ABU9X4D4_9GAMM|nr:TatD family hydrolase [uncultured Psychrobacter sp.]